MGYRANFVVLFFLVCSICIAIAISISYNGDVTSTPNEKIALDKLKRIVIGKIPKSSRVYEYAKDDLYLLRWLQASSMDVHKAKDKILNHLKWRKTEQIDDIDLENWSFMERDFPMFLGRSDKEGRPLVEKWFGEWEMQQGIYDGNSETIRRYILLELEVLTRQLYQSRASGRNVTGAVILDDMKGFSFTKQACPLCLSLWIDWVSLYENNYPQIVQKVYMVNVPRPWYLVYRAMYPFMSESTKDIFLFFTNNEEAFQQLDDIVDQSERSLRLGGTL